MVWYRELGFYNNPFSIKPGAYSAEIIGYDLTELLGKIDEGKVIFIEGEYGFGKTTMLKHIIRQFGGRKKLAYYNCNRTDDSIDVAGILKGAGGFMARLSGSLPGDIMLLLDEVERLSPDDQGQLMDFYKSGNLKSVVFFGPNFDRIGFSVELRKLMVNNVIKLTELTDAEAVQLVRERIGNLKLLDDETIIAVFRHSEKNPRIMLENLEDLSKYAVDNNEEQITADHLKEVFGISPDTNGKEAAKKPAVEKKADPKPQPKTQAPAVKSQPKVPPRPQPKPQPKPATPVRREDKKLAVIKRVDAKAKSEKPRSQPKAQAAPAKPQSKPQPKPLTSKKPADPKKRPAPHDNEKFEEFETKNPPKKGKSEPPMNEDFEEPDYSEPADDDDQGGEYYYYY